jgi:perosamine synthetase
MYTILLENKKIRDNLHNFLIKKEIFSKVYFHPIHKTKFYSKFNAPNNLPMTEMISNIALTIPLYPNMTQEEKEYLVNSILEFFDSM